MQRTAIINGATVTYDKDYSLPAVALMTPGVVEGLEVTTNSVAPGKAFIQVERTATSPSEIFYIIFENTTAVTIDTTGTKKVFIKKPKANLNDPGYNPASGEGIATIQTDTDYPAEDYIPLASITAGVITDARENVSIKQEVEENGILLPKCTVQNKTANYTFTGSEKNNTGFSTNTAGGNVTYTLDLSLFDLTKGLYEFTFCKSTSDVNTVIIDVGSGNAIDGEQTYILTSQWETVTIKIVSSTFAKTVSTTNKAPEVAPISQTTTTGKYGETITMGNALYLGADGKLYKARADDTAKIKVLCHAQESGVLNDVKKITIRGLAENQSGLTAGAVFLSNTPGATSSTPGTNTVYLGESLEATKYIMKPLYQTDYGLGTLLGSNGGTVTGASWVTLVTFVVTGTVSKKIKSNFNSYKGYSSSYSVWGQGRIINASDVVQWSAVFYNEGTTAQTVNLTLAPGTYRLQGASNNASYPNNGIGQGYVYDEIKIFI